jgi:hypothetical protein
MTNEEINELLLSELPKAKKNGVLSDLLKSLFYQICRKTVDSEKYKYYDDDTKYIFVVNGYEACTKHAIKFNSEKSENAYGYINTIIRCSIAQTIVKINKS